MIDKLNNCPINTFVGSVYNFNELTLQELLSKFFSKINESVDTVNKAYEFWKWVQEQGISEETKKVINQMYQDGRLTEIINQLANDVKSQVQEIKTDLTSYKTEYEEFKTSTDETLNNHSSQLEQIIDKTTKINMTSEDGTKWILYIDNYGQIGVIKEV